MVVVDGDEDVDGAVAPFAAGQVAPGEGVEGGAGADEAEVPRRWMLGMLLPLQLSKRWLENLAGSPGAALQVAQADWQPG